MSAIIQEGERKLVAGRCMQCPAMQRRIGAPPQERTGKRSVKEGMNIDAGTSGMGGF